MEWIIYAGIGVISITLTYSISYEAGYSAKMKEIIDDKIIEQKEYRLRKIENDCVVAWKEIRRINERLERKKK